jgi:tetratricopeptide (TPR) repeat protein
MLDEPKEALVSYRAAGKVLDGVIAQDPKNLAALTDRVVCHENIGEALLAMRDAKLAAEAYHDAVAITGRLRVLAPDDVRWPYFESVLYDDVGDAQHNLGARREAVDSYRHAVASIETVYQRDPTRIEWASQLGASHNLIATMLVEDGDFAIARSEAQAAVDVSRALLRHVPDDVRVLDLHAQFLQQLGKAQLGLDQREDAFASARESVEVAEKILAHDSTNGRAKFMLFNLREDYADALKGLKRYREAREQLELAIKLVHEVLAEHPGDEGATHELPILQKRLAVLPK